MAAPLEEILSGLLVADNAVIQEVTNKFIVVISKHPLNLFNDRNRTDFNEILSVNFHFL